MCFVKPIIPGFRHLEARIATRPIRVLKAGTKIGDNFESRVYPKLYEKGVLYKDIPIKAELSISSEHVVIERGFHSYRYILCEDLDLKSKSNWSYYIYPHSIGIFEIPQGAIYYSYYNLFVSDSIKLIKVIDSAEEWAEEKFKPEIIL